MTKDPIARRLWLTAALVACGILLMQGLSHGEPVISRVPLQEFPEKIGNWVGREIRIPARIVADAGMNEYVSRVYRNPRGKTVTLFISYYRSQRTGETIHSPKNCLPGGGWQPLESREISIPMANGSRVVANEYVIARDAQRMLVLYWYQERGRDIASEYAAKLWLSVDAITRHRTDGGFVRVTTTLKNDRASAERLAISFVRLIDPRLPRYIPN
jgi:EpsI family protein